MDVNFELILVILVGVTGLVYLLDILMLRRQRPEGGTVSPLVEYSVSFFPVLLVVLVLRSFLVEPFKIPTGSMIPTLLVGDYILVNKFAYGIRLPVIGTEIIPVGKPKRGDVMVFKYPEKPSINYIKRVIGVPGDHIRYENKQLFINGVPMKQTLLAQLPAGDPEFKIYNEELGKVNHEIMLMTQRPNEQPMSWVVPKDSYFMMGDNRDNSRDSRYWGFVPDKLIVGKAFAVWMHMPDWVPSFSHDRFIK